MNELLNGAVLEIDGGSLLTPLMTNRSLDGSILSSARCPSVIKNEMWKECVSLDGDGNVSQGLSLSADVIIVGAGIGGLITAREIAKQGWRVLVLEAGDRFGGQAREICLTPEAIASVHEGSKDTVPTKESEENPLPENSTERVRLRRRKIAERKANECKIQRHPIRLLGVPEAENGNHIRMSQYSELNCEDSVTTNSFATSFGCVIGGGESCRLKSVQHGSLPYCRVDSSGNSETLDVVNEALTIAIHGCDGYDASRHKLVAKEVERYGLPVAFYDFPLTKTHMLLPRVLNREPLFHTLRNALIPEQENSLMNYSSIQSDSEDPLISRAASSIEDVVENDPVYQEIFRKIRSDMDEVAEANGFGDPVIGHLDCPLVEYLAFLLEEAWNKVVLQGSSSKISAAPHNPCRGEVSTLRCSPKKLGPQDIFTNFSSPVGSPVSGAKDLLKAKKLTGERVRREIISGYLMSQFRDLFRVSTQSQTSTSTLHALYLLNWFSTRDKKNFFSLQS